MMEFGLSKEALDRIQKVFANASKINRVWIFGSRALGRQKAGSDIDLAVEGQDLEFDDLLDIRYHLENLMLPFRFDVVDIAKVSGESLGNHIARVGVLIFDRE